MWMLGGCVGFLSAYHYTHISDKETGLGKSVGPPIAADGKYKRKHAMMRRRASRGKESGVPSRVKLLPK